MKTTYRSKMIACTLSIDLLMLIMALILSEYFKIFNEYSTKYGKNVAVLMQVGSFYEMYGVSNNYDKRGNAEELSRILNIVLTKKNKKLLGNSLNNPLMLGFPCPALSKYIPVLLEESYTVVVVDQVRNNDKPLDPSIKRVVVDVVSPSINMLNTSFNDNYLVLIYIDAHQHIGMSAISVITGKSVVYECYSYPDDKNRSLDDALGFLKQYMPKEVVISGKHSENIVSYLELDDTTCHSNTVYKKRLDIEYCESVISLVFTKEPGTIVSNIELLGLERMPNALLSYVMLIEFVYDHNPILLRKMLLPDIFSATSRLVLSTSTIEQLNVAGPGCKKSTLFSVVNKCSTNAGKRLLMARILAPSVDIKEITGRYDQVENFGVLFGDKVEHVDTVLKKIVDIERLQRRMLVGIITPGELASLCLSYEAVLELHNLLELAGAGAKVFTKKLHGYKDILEEFVGICRYAFDIDSMLTSEPCLNDGVCDKIDKLKGSIRSQMNIIESAAMSIGIKNPRIDYNNTTGYYISVTCSQAKAIKSSDVVIRYNTASCKVTSPVIDAASKVIVSLSNALKECTQRVYKSILECLLSYSQVFERVVGFVSNIDLVKSSFVISSMYNYCRPIIAEGPSFVDAKDLRHPIIERIDDGNRYVPNDIVVGRGYNGIILYSMNSCGKTSLLRALGLSVILAQAGLFVPASCFTFCPFKCMMTRILSRDNIMKGQSSFVAEMSELRAILKRATGPSTLVLADEITHGTEHTSGSSIFISSVEMLAKRRVNFLFTTHLHSVYPFVKDIQNVGIFHLSVHINSEQNARKIVFERKLRPGPGGSIYGLEVCDFIGMDNDFIARAFQIRNMITFDKTDNSIKAKPRPNKYNNKKMVQCCEGCGYYPRLPTDSRLDTHHVKHQSLADKNGMINGVHKNAMSNLRTLCKQCHAKEHINQHQCL